MSLILPRSLHRCCIAACGALTTLVLGMAAMADGTGSWRDLYRDARPLLDIRYRFEFVDQADRPEQARANTVRTRAGIESGRYFGLGGLFDIDWVEAVGSRRFNDTVNGDTRFPVVADPDDLQINQLYAVADRTIPHTLVKLGRQRIIWDDHRFIGHVGFRQNEQTFDAARGTLMAGDKAEVEYVYLDQVNRVFGTDSAAGRLGLRSHGLRAQHRDIAGHVVTPFALLLDYTSQARTGDDRASFGARLQGRQALGKDWSLFYVGSAAYQRDYADNPNAFDLWYGRLVAGLSARGSRARLGYELLQGDGSIAFQTPLATLHKFNGLTDKFLTTPPDGLQDVFFALTTALPGRGWLSDLNLKAAVHGFFADEGGTHYGREWNAGIFKKIASGAGGFNLGLQYASYKADNFSTDTDKLWITVRYALGPKPFRAYRQSQTD